MNTKALRTDLPVLLLYNLDPAWPTADLDHSRCLANQLSAALQREGHPVTTLVLQDGDLAGKLAAYNPNEFIVFNWCEEIPGIPHSAARPAEICEQMGFTFTGADAQALALSIDKHRIKLCLNQRCIPTPRWRICTGAEKAVWSGYQAIVKPAFEHCSYGITAHSVVTSAAELTQRVNEVLSELQQPALVEEFIAGREFTVSIIGNGRLHVLPVMEVDFSAIADPCQRIRTFDSKFRPGSPSFDLVKTVVPAQLEQDQLQQLIATACAAYRATGCRDYARLDFRLGHGTFYVLDVNQNADLSPDASLALTAQAAGISYGALCSYLINLAARRHPIFKRWVS